MLKIQCDQTFRDSLPAYMKWQKPDRYLVTSDKHTDTCGSLTEARKYARIRIKTGTTQWSEIYRWAVNGTMLRKVFICSYDLET